MLALLLCLVMFGALAGETQTLRPTSWLGDIVCADSLAFLGASGKVVVVALPEGRVVNELPFPGQVRALAWDGKGVVAAGGWNTVRAWRWPEGQLLWEDGKTEVSVRCLAFTPIGLLLGGGANGGVLAWDAKTGERLWTLQAHASPVWGLAASPKASVFATAGSDRVAVWDLASRSEIQTFTGRAWDVAFSPDGFLLAAGMGKILKVWDTAVWLLLWEVWAHESCTVAVAFSQDGNLIATGSLDQRAKVWEVSTGQAVWTSPVYQTILSAVQFSPAGLLLAGAEDGTLILWRP